MNELNTKWETTNHSKGKTKLVCLLKPTDLGEIKQGGRVVRPSQDLAEIKQDGRVLRPSQGHIKITNIRRIALDARLEPTRKDFLLKYKPQGDR